MAFGRIRRHREKKRDKRRSEERKRKQELAAANSPEKMKEDIEQVQQTVTEADKADEARREEEREKHKQESEEDVTTKLPGLDEETKAAMRASANTAISRQISDASRRMASQSGRMGVKGGAAMNPQSELYGSGLEAQMQFQRDLAEQDSDVAMKRLAAYLASLEGKSAESVLRRQQYIDYILSKQAQNKQQVDSSQYKVQ